MSVFLWFYIGNVFLNYNDNMHWSLRSFDVKLEGYEGDHEDHKNEGRDLNMLIEQKSRMMFAFILLITGFFFDYQQETVQRRYTGFLLILVSAFKGASHIINELRDCKENPLDILAL